LLGLTYSGALAKRAIQFGTHIAKQFPKTRHTKGTELIGLTWSWTWTWTWMNEWYDHYV
jgi:hypothetical protein